MSECGMVHLTRAGTREASRLATSLQVRSILPYVAMCLRIQNRSVALKVSRGEAFPDVPVERRWLLLPFPAFGDEKSKDRLATDAPRRSHRGRLPSELSSS